MQLPDISANCFKVASSQVPLGATPEYLSGHYMLQSAASMLPVRVLNPQPGEKVLDLAAAPGGKTTHIAQLMRNRGIVVANDLKKERLKALHFNCMRMGVSNVIVTNYDGRKFPTCLKNFDRVLLDAPCSGTGGISRDKSIKVKRSVADIKRQAHIQRELLRSAIDLCRVGGFVVYSTCSISIDENEKVIQYALDNRHVKIMNHGLELQCKTFTKFKEYRFNQRMKHCIRTYPHVNNLDGFFICKLKKLKDGPKNNLAEQN